MGSGQRLSYDPRWLWLCAWSMMWNGSFAKRALLTVAPVSNNLVLAYLGQHVLAYAEIVLQPDYSLATLIARQALCT